MAAADAQRKAADAAAYARLDAACSTRAPVEFNDVQILMMTGRVLQLRRVEGDDGPGDEAPRDGRRGGAFASISILALSRQGELERNRRRGAERLFF